MNLDIKGMYVSFKIMNTKADVLDMFQRHTSVMELFVKSITNNYIKILKNLKVKKIFGFKRQIDYLKKEKVISNDLHHNLLILSKIRNKITHKIFTDKTIFNKLNEIRINDNFINNLKTDSRKYQIIASYCTHQLFSALDKIAPEETLHLESTPETKFELMKDPFS